MTSVVNGASGPSGAPGVQHRDLANAIRFLAADAVQKANSGHPGMPMGMADVATVLFTRFLKFSAAHPDWPDRDRFVLSAGHGSMLLYALLHLNGYPGMPMDELARFRQLGSATPGHPEYGHTPGVETTTGPLGQGIGTAVGMALAERMLNAEFGDPAVDHFTYVIAGDGCLMEGITQEAISLAGHLRLARLIVLWDDNHITIDGATSLSTSDDQLTRFTASGWDVAAVDGHDPEAVAAAIERARKDDRSSLIACRTTIGFGAPTKAGTESTHGAPLGDAEIAGARQKLGWTVEPFVVPDHILSAWRAAGRRGEGEREKWERRVGALNKGSEAELRRRIAGELPAGWREAMAEHARKMVAEKPKWATRQSSGAALGVLTGKVPEMVGGSADLTGSNNTFVKSMPFVSRTNYQGRYINYGVREHGMAAAMNGLALHGGFIPYAGTFLVFSDYMRPSLRLAALMGIRVIHVLTHDSIGLGEDGPTHQPVETLASLRTVPNLLVFRPADAVETAECWMLALQNKTGPSVLALSRQAVPTLRTQADINASARGAYVLAEAEGGKRSATLLATGTEVSLALDSRAALQAEGIPTAVVSMPCWELFDRQDQAYRQSVLGAGSVRVAVEAAVGFGWERYVGERGSFVGMAGFGASAPAPDLYRHFGITAERVAGEVRRLLG